MDKIRWCLKQQKGIILIKSNINLSESYLKQSKSDLQNIKKQDSVWGVIISYYTCYNALYSLLIRYGIKSEIHSCSIELLKLFEKLKDYHQFLTDLKENRINTQYYLKKPKPPKIDKLKTFIDLCELEIIECNQEKIELLNKKIIHLKLS